MVVGYIYRSPHQSLASAVASVHAHTIFKSGIVAAAGTCNLYSACFFRSRDRGNVGEAPLTGNVEGSYVLPDDDFYYQEDPVAFDGPDDYGGIAQRSVGRLVPTFQSLCPSVLTPVYLNMSIYRQYRYDEITCLHPYDGPVAGSGKHNHNKVCGGAGFACIQRNRTILLLKRTENSCYETESRTINSGCECVWPKHSLGDIQDYHG